MSSSDIVLYFSCELQGFIETQPERQSPGDRQPDLGLTPHEFVGKLPLPFKQGEEIASLYQSHRAFLRKNNVLIETIEPLNDEQIEKEMERDLREQIAHNITKGVLKHTPEGDVKYSWRGMIYLWCQFLLDLVRL